MKVSVKFEVLGSTLDELRRNAAACWKEFNKNDDAELPHDTEMQVEPHAASDYKATVYARTKIEDNNAHK